MDASWCMRRSKDLRSGAPDKFVKVGSPKRLSSLLADGVIIKSKKRT